MRNLCVTARYKVSLSGNCVTARKQPLTCAKGVTRPCVTRNSRAVIVTLCVAVRNRVAYQQTYGLTCMFLDHLGACYAVTQKRETHARPGEEKRSSR